MKATFKRRICEKLGAADLVELETIQSLWSGYGKIARYRVMGGRVDTVVVKLVQFPTAADHPRGWNSDRSHERKVRSYGVESHWYSNFNDKCDETCRVPRCYATGTEGEETMIALEDLDAAGFDVRRRSLKARETAVCLRWLAEFHATFLGAPAGNLWSKGTYWHLDTRPDELEVLDDVELRKAAGEIDRLLDQCRFKTLVHGDAKLANFCFSGDGKRVAAVDFQYVGSGCGMKDVAYFIGSCLDEVACEEQEGALLASYFGGLKSAMDRRGKGADFEALEAEWRVMYPIAWTDFHRFIKGWSPGHWKVNGYSERLAREVVAGLGNAEA